MIRNSWKNPDFVAWYNANLTPETRQIQTMFERLHLGPHDNLVDFGCGDGTVLEFAAHIANSVVGLDLSQEQIDIASRKLSGYANVDLVQSGFLDFELPEKYFNRACDRKSLHHLTDAEKALFFQRASVCLVPGSLFIVEDAVFDFPVEDAIKNRKNILEDAEKFYGTRWETIREAFLFMLEKEYPTDFAVWEEAMISGGFIVVESWRITSFYGVILARKTLDRACGSIKKSPCPCQAICDYSDRGLR